MQKECSPEGLSNARTIQTKVQRIMSSTKRNLTITQYNTEKTFSISTVEPQDKHKRQKIEEILNTSIL